MLNKKYLYSCILFICLLSLPVSARAEPINIGEVLFVRGVVSAGPAKGEVRFLGKGMPLFEGDVLCTSADSFAVIRMTDGSQMTLRPNTLFVLEKYSHKKKKQSALLRLFRGGLRAVTGLISKLNSRCDFRIHTPTAVIGVRGTEFDARLCEEDCAEDTPQIEGKEAPLPSPVVGRVTHLRGLLTARAEDNTERRLIKGGPVYEGDTLEIESNSIAVVVFRDNSRVALHGQTRFKVEHYQYRQGKKDNIFLRLFKGGLRTLTGLIARHDPGAFKVGTPTAILGVRGTGFDVSLCEDDCTAETTNIAGRVVRLKGHLTAISQDKAVRELVKGGPIYENDTLETGPDSMAVIAFRDDTRVTLQVESSFKVEQYQYRAKKDDNVLFRLLKGGMRTLIGIVVRHNPRALKIHTSTAILGVRGTGVDLLYGRAGQLLSAEATVLKEDRLYVHVWDGTVELKPDIGGELVIKQGRAAYLPSEGAPSLLPEVPEFMLANPQWRPDRVKVDLKTLFRSQVPGKIQPGLYLNVWDGTVELKPEKGKILVLNQDQAAYMPKDGKPTLLPATPAFMLDNPAPRPDRLEIDMQNLFGAKEIGTAPAGLYVSVYDGHVTLENDAGSIELGRDEAGYASSQDQHPERLDLQPLFQVEDLLPSPKGFDESVELQWNSDNKWQEKDGECEIR
ncbi:MAG: FecR family protein [Proteobacteria bacterium]|nr:FecR family protein [Pseudomonadota bacterium]